MSICIAIYSSGSNFTTIAFSLSLLVYFFFRCHPALPKAPIFIRERMTKKREENRAWTVSYYQTQASISKRLANNLAVFFSF